MQHSNFNKSLQNKLQNDLSNKNYLQNRSCLIVKITKNRTEAGFTKAWDHSKPMEKTTLPSI